MKHFSLLFFLVLCITACEMAEQKEPAKAHSFLAQDWKQLESFLTNADSENPNFEKIDALFETFIAQQQVVGMSVAVAYKGKLVYAKGFGYADAEAKKQLQPYHMLRIASVSKLITAIAIMKLVEQKKLNLHDKVFGKNGILNDPMFLKMSDKRMEKIEIMHLLTHSGGWRNRFRSDPMFKTLEIAQYMKTPPPADLSTLIRFMLNEEMIAEPGTFYDYSNFGYAVLGKVVEKVSGKNYAAFVKENIFEPLGIHYIQVGHNQRKNKLLWESCYYDHPNAPKRISIYGTGDSVSRAYEGSNIEVMLAAGGWVATASDLLKLGLAVDGFTSLKDILTPESIEQMTLSKKDSTENKVLGWRQCDKVRWWRTGSLASTTAVLKIHKQDEWAWVCLTNTGSWRGPYFVYDIEGVVNRAIATLRNKKEATQKNLFINNR
ncbi:MAG: class A beta-lactamase-related serine hydrolase [Cytophagales bacterium]|nr:MAG: class A beta-lactamase-related serine hydrolase [Cytophagales bacterium]